MSRHSETRSESVASRNRATFSSLSTWVSACGWTTISQAVALPHLLAQPLGQRGQVAPLLGRERVGSSTSPVLSSRQKDGMTTRCLAPMAWASAAIVGDVRPGLLPDGLAVVQAGEDRAGRDLQATPGRLLGEDGGVGRQIAVGAELDPLVAGLRDLVEEALPGDLGGIVREPDAPAVGGRSDPDAGK